MRRNDLDDWHTVHEAYSEGASSPFWRDVLGDIAALRMSIQREAAEGKLPADRAMFGLYLLDRVTAIPEVVLMDAMGEAERAMMEEGLTDLEDTQPQSLF